MAFSNGDLFKIKLRNGIYQVLGLYTIEQNMNIYYFRKVFDGKLVMKMGTAELIHESWMSKISKSTQEKLQAILSDPDVRAKLDNLSIDRAMIYGTRGAEELGYCLCIMKPTTKKMIEKRINQEIQDYLDITAFDKFMKVAEENGELKIVNAFSTTPSDYKLYRIEFGNYCDDFDESGKEKFRLVRFKEIKV